MNKRIILAGKEVLLDTADVERVMQYKWQFNPSNGAIERRHHVPGQKNCRTGRKRETWNLHRFIMGFPPQEVDHINHDRLDNRKANLRLASRSQNQANTRTRAKSGFRGVTMVKNRFIAQAGKDGRHFYLGSFKTVEDAAKAYDAFASKAWSEFATLNARTS
jgi:hypothetical protein